MNESDPFGDLIRLGVTVNVIFYVVALDNYEGQVLGLGFNRVTVWSRVCLLPLNGSAVSVDISKVN